MAIRDTLLPEYDHEMGVTRRVLDRVREEDFPWKPHERSMTLGELVGHLASIPAWCSAVLEGASFDLSGRPDDVRPVPASHAALLKEFDARVSAARASLAQRTDGEMLAPWTLKSGTHEIFTLPRISAVRGFIMNHSIHHRGQLSVYLRLRNVPLPAMYGPSADEG
jgi:uncharacterized damage-inducible protein DinB